MKLILFKKSMYKKYGNVALIKDAENNTFIVAYHYTETGAVISYTATPAENKFPYSDSTTEIKALKDAIAKYENIKK